MLIGENSYTRYNNTGVLGPIAGGFQGAVSRADMARRGMGGLGDLFTFGTPGINPDSSTSTTSPAIDPATVTAINSEMVFAANLWRSLTGQAPLPPQSSAPSVNVGLTPDAKNMLLLGGAGLLAVILLKRKR